MKLNAYITLHFLQSSFLREHSVYWEIRININKTYKHENMLTELWAIQLWSGLCVNTLLTNTIPRRLVSSSRVPVMDGSSILIKLWGLRLSNVGCGGGVGVARVTSLSNSKCPVTGWVWGSINCDWGKLAAVLFGHTMARCSGSGRPEHGVSL